MLSSIYCAEGEFLLLPAAEDGLVVQIHCSAGGGEPGLEASLRFHLSPDYPSCPPGISLSCPAFSRAQSHSLRQELLQRASALPPEPMLHQLVLIFQEQCVALMKPRGGGEEVEEEQEGGGGTAVLLLNHMRSQKRYIGLLQDWSQQLQLAGRLLLGRSILVVLQGHKQDIKEFCHRLRTVKVDVDSSGKRCKERMMKVLMEIPSSGPNSFQGFAVKECESSSELMSAFQELQLGEVYQQIQPSLRT